tara:strand:- start:56 stop:355 length:300 start_codon:yes stop_codon:yes gene_type:complete
MPQQMDTWVRYQIIKQLGASITKTDLNSMNVSKNRWNGVDKIYHLEKVSSTGKSVKCKIWSYDTRKIKEYKQLSIKKMVEDIIQEHKNTSSIGVEPDEW